MQRKLTVKSDGKPDAFSFLFRRFVMTVAAASVFAAASLGADVVGAARNGNDNWVGTWSTALHEPDLGVPGLSNPGFDNQTIRLIAHSSVGGTQVRVRLSTFGAGRLAIGSAHIALRSAGSGIVAGTDRILTFSGKTSITAPAGAPVLSDPVNLIVPPLSDLAVSIFVPGKTPPAAWHFESRQTTFVSPAGDFTAATVMPGGTTTAVAFFWLAGVDVLTSRQTGAIVAFGDSLTDGTQSTLDANARWPDQLARRLMEHRSNQPMGVLNEGIAGGRMLRDSLGPNALARFDRDVLSHSGVTDVIVQLGGNDIFTINPAEEVTVDEVIQGHRQLIVRAHDKGLKIYGCTLNPVEGFLLPGTPIPVFSPAHEAKRQAVKEWIRTSGAYDGVIDFDRVLRDPNSPARILAMYDSGDHAHPTDAGYRAMADAIDLSLFFK